MDYKDETFADQEVLLDGNRYENCKFRGCLLWFKGISPTAIVRCDFHESRWMFGGQAVLALDFLSGLCQLHPQAGEEILQAIRDGRFRGGNQ